MYRECHAQTQTPNTGLRHLSFGGRCRKAMLGVWRKVPESDARSVAQTTTVEEVGRRAEWESSEVLLLTSLTPFDR